MAQVGRERDAARLEHLPALDGYRGLAVAAVVLFHTGVIDGGWLGVDVFFVLSGFLITRLLIAERADTGRIDLGGFWRRRGRRLLPALAVFLVGVAAYAWWYPDPALLPSDLTGQMVATIFYVANWFQLAQSTGYWDQFATPSPLLHMWSLAIEEQFYVLFPLAVVALVAWRRTRRHLGWVLAAGAVASWGLGVARLAAGDGFERVYLGTDTRVGAILCGAAVAHLVSRPGGAAVAVRVARPLAPFAFVAVVAAMVAVDGERAWSPQRWLLMPAFELAVAVLLVCATVTGPRRPDVNVAASLPPLRWLGAISYGLYLWHIPILLAAEREAGEASRWVLVPVVIAVSLAVAQVSYLVVEQPIRRGGLAVAPRFVLAGVGVVAALLAVTVTYRSTEVARADESARVGDGAQIRLEAVDEPVDAGDLPSPDEPRSLPLPRPTGRDARVLLVGDSMARDLAPGFDETARTLGVLPSEASFVGCGVGGLDVNTSDPTAFNTEAYAAECDEWLGSFDQLVDTAKPDVVVLMRATARRTIPPDVERVDPCGDAYRSWYRAELQAEVDVLSAEGATVAIATRPYARFGDTVQVDVDDETTCLNEEIAAVAAADPAAVVLPVREWVCPDLEARTCIDSVDGVTLRPDGLHFRGPGAEVATRWIVDQLYGP